MKADISRTTFNRLKHFSRVVAQQGRVQLDADWNEQSSIMLYQLRCLAADIIGPAGGPAGHLGFGFTDLDPSIVTAAGGDFAIGAGRYYVDGILCELDATWLPVTFADGQNRVRPAELSVDGRPFRVNQYVGLMDADPATGIPPVRARIIDIDYAERVLTLTDIGPFASKEPKQPRLQRITTFRTQPEGVSARFADLDKGVLQLYLDVWERLVTHVEDDAIREVALNGPDTSARTKVVWQVGALQANGAAAACMTPDALREALQPADRGRLRARVRPGPTDTDPCTIDPDAAYRGHENQLYRVEIHRGSAGGAKPTFKWSRENGAVVLPILSANGSTLVLDSLGRDDRFGLVEGDWVEVQDDDSVAANRADALLRVQSIHRGKRRVILSGSVPGEVGRDPSKHPLLRRWDQKEGDAEAGGFPLDQDDHAVPIPDAAAGQEAWIELEDGVEIQFVAPGDSVYRTGDYWLIPARVATGDVEWPHETVPGTGEKRPLAILPHGVTHHYAPLGIVQWDGNSFTPIRDCRLQLPGATPVAARRRS
ncbi:hypothetical protein KXR53_23415 [Inquilinus limosus]|uniref:DUF6519 domain-containing protein n=1 Tax=Inquilinus limosus TaxID=171674 RepID=UPI003F1421A1